VNTFMGIAQISFMKKYALVTIALAVSVLILGATVVNAPQTMSASASECRCDNILFDITVTGTGVVRVKPSIATISLSVETKSKNLADAQSENAKIVQKLIKALYGENIAEQDISTSWFNIYPEYDYSLGQRFLGHKVSNQLNIKVRDIANVGGIVDLVTAAGANIVNGVQFGVEDNSAAYNEALTKAIESAKQKAAVLLSVTGFGDVRIISVKETSINYIGFGRYAMSDGAGCYTSIMSNDIEIAASIEVVFARNN